MKDAEYWNLQWKIMLADLHERGWRAKQKEMRDAQ